MSLSLNDALLLAAEIALLAARALRECHTPAPEHTDWTESPPEEEAKAKHDLFVYLANECRRHAAINYAQVECPDFERTSEHLITPELRAAIEGKKP